MTNDQSIVRLQLEANCKSGARWFIWIAVLSLITSVITLTGSQWGFIVSLGITQIADAIASSMSSEFGNIPKILALVFDLFIVGIFVLFGVYAEKKSILAFVVGMTVYGVDALIFILGQDWLAIGFHAFALYGMFGGYRACSALLALEKEAIENQIGADSPRVPETNVPPSSSATS